MATRYLYNNQKYNSLYALRQAIGKTERLTYGTQSTQEEFDQLPLQNKVTVEEYDPLDEIDLEVLRSQRSIQMKSAFNSYRNSPQTSITSSLGFKVNANIDAFDNVEGCITQIENGLVEAQAEGQEATITFMDFTNTPHDLTLEQLKTLKAEIAANGSRAYAKKWEYRTQIASADREALKTMTSFSFE
nr:MAG TPA: protein of unknown function DUF4376 [Caudoviricetes sp.]